MTLAITLAVFLVIATASTAATDDSARRRDSSTFLVPKRSYSNHTRFVFFAGLEGTGHHAVQAMLDVCHDEGFCEGDALLSRLLFVRNDKHTALYTYHTELDGKASLQGARKLFVRHLSEVMDKKCRDEDGKEEVGGQQVARLVTLNGLKGTGLDSYPSMAGEDKALQHPDIVALAKLCERAGADLRMFVLTRSAKDLFVADTVHRHFESNAIREAAILADNAAVLATQLHLLDPAFVTCLPYDSLGDAAWWQRPTTTLHQQPHVVVTRESGKEEYDIKTEAAAAGGMSLQSQSQSQSHLRWLHPSITESLLQKMLRPVRDHPTSHPPLSTSGGVSTSRSEEDDDNSPYMEHLADAVFALEVAAKC
jgi:hypothetical protein